MILLKFEKSNLGGDGGNEFTRSGWGVFVEWCNNTIRD